MKQIFYFIIILLSACSSSKVNKTVTAYVPDDKELYNVILKMDSVYFTAYNTCDMDTQNKLYSDSIEFYHDLGGLSTSKSGLLESIKINICGKVTRELVKQSVEVYPVKNYGAIEIGWHTFYNKTEGTTSRAGRFVIVWQHKNSQWKITRVISLH